MWIFPGSMATECFSTQQGQMRLFSQPEFCSPDTLANSGMSCLRSPETMLAALRRWPAARTLEDVKDCLDYCSTAWLQLFCRLGGAPLLLEARLPPACSPRLLGC